MYVCIKENVSWERESFIFLHPQKLWTGNLGHLHDNTFKPKSKIIETINRTNAALIHMIEYLLHNFTFLCGFLSHFHDLNHPKIEENFLMKIVFVKTSYFTFKDSCF